jgi:guanyl-specific ribonuclease Sa
MCGAAWAQSASSGAGNGSGSAQAAAPNNGKRVCVNAEMNGVQALSYDCLSQQLAPTPSAAASSVNPAEAQAKAPSNQVGTFNYSAESIRFGNAWGKSVTPQRPAPTPAAPVK